MKKFIAAALAALAVFGMMTAREKESRAFEITTIKEVCGNVVSADALSKITLKGQKESGGGYYTNIRIEIADENGSPLTVIKPPVDGGYNPDVILCRFDDSGVSQIFLSADSGGSGGFGYYYVYSYQDKNLDVLFDFEKFGNENKFCGRFLDGYSAELRSADGSENWRIDLGGKPYEYKYMIWNGEGKLRRPTPLDVSGVNSVFPYYNGTDGKCWLEVTQKVTGVAQAYSLGYVSSRLVMEDGVFRTFMRALTLYPDERNF